MKAIKNDNRIPIPDNAQFYTVQNLMGLFQLSRQTIHTMTLSGQLPQPYKFGRVLRYKRTDIDLFIESNKPKPIKLPNKPL